MTVGDVGNRSQEIYTRIFGKPGVRGFDLFFLRPPFFSFRFGKATAKDKTTSCAVGVGRAGFCCLACCTGKPHTEGRKRKKRKGTICQSLLLSFPDRKRIIIFHLALLVAKGFDVMTLTSIPPSPPKKHPCLLQKDKKQLEKQRHRYNTFFPR